MKLLYFSLLRDQIGVSEENLQPPKDVATVGQLVAWLAQRSSGHAAAFADQAIVSCAVNQEYAKLDVALGADDEVAFFPPVTGG